MIVKFERLEKKYDETTEHDMDTAYMNMWDPLKEFDKKLSKQRQGDMRKELRDLITSRVSGLSIWNGKITEFDWTADPKIINLNHGYFGINGFRYSANAIEYVEKETISSEKDKATVYCWFESIRQKAKKEAREEIIDLLYEVLYNTKNRNAVYNESTRSPDTDYKLFEQCTLDVEKILDKYDFPEKNCGMINSIIYVEDKNDDREHYKINGDDYFLVEMN